MWPWIAQRDGSDMFRWAVQRHWLGLVHTVWSGVSVSWTGRLLPEWGKSTGLMYSGFRCCCLGPLRHEFADCTELYPQ